MLSRKSFLAIVVTGLLVAMVSGTVSGEISVEGQLYRERVVEAGQSYNGTITVSNKGNSKVAVKVYQTDYQTDASGRVDYGNPGDQERSNADWIKLDQDQLQIAPGARKNFRYDVTVPKGDLAGSYWSTIMVEPLPGDSEETQQRGTTLTQTVRYCVKIVTHIGETGKRAIEIVGVDLSRKDGEIFLDVGAQNTGTRVIYPEVWAEIYNRETGEKLGRFEGGRQHVFPGSSVGYNIGLSDISKGSYRTMLVFDNGDENVWGAQFKLNI